MMSLRHPFSAGARGATFMGSILWTGLTVVAALVLIALPSAARAQSTADTSVVQLDESDVGARAFVAWPAGRKSTPAVVLAHDWWGFNPQVRRVARTIARQGYVVVVPDIYRGVSASSIEDARRLAGELDHKRAAADLDRAIAWLRAQERTTDSKIAAVGVGIGGGLVQHLAMRSEELSAVVMINARPAVHAYGLRSLSAPLHAHFAAEDSYVDVSLAHQLRSALQEAGKTGRVFVYQGAHHDFLNEARDQYHPDAARLVWARTLSFLQTTLKGSG